ncbi:flavin reductase family protein [Orenia marismortui]|uniref:Flavin reductase (DIM6/NTAB) family NADH-FMN oxidoreductase RutF n=1 Tax=Orenia marismortui TaxID=46469 RepID=A0A4R8GYI9_9FIRM|nr:flavin reductase family protein [Orenia marismortui]TDX51406.1 flavin reductase (DIM6/NTAB) family NADH-FMN oxidoreductase RutF [Orenia marismortui]
MKKELETLKNCIQPRPNLIVSCRDEEGKDNALAVAYAGNCSYDPPMLMVGVVPSRYSYDIVKETGVFVVNLVPQELEKEYYYLGSHSGRDEDKIKNLNLEVKDGIEVNAPLLVDFPVNIECRVVDSILTGSHEMFIGKVERVHLDKKLLNDEGKVDLSKIKLL